MLLAIAQKTIKGPDAVGYQVVGFEEIEVLLGSTDATEGQVTDGHVRRDIRRDRHPRHAPSSL